MYIHTYGSIIYTWPQSQSEPQTERLMLESMWTWFRPFLSIGRPGIPRVHLDDFKHASHICPLLPVPNTAAPNSIVFQRIPMQMPWISTSPWKLPMPWPSWRLWPPRRPGRRRSQCSQHPRGFRQAPRRRPRRCQPPWPPASPRARRGAGRTGRCRGGSSTCLDPRSGLGGFWMMRGWCCDDVWDVGHDVFFDFQHDLQKDWRDICEDWRCNRKQWNTRYLWRCLSTKKLNINSWWLFHLGENISPPPPVCRYDARRWWTLRIRDAWACAKNIRACQAGAMGQHILLVDAGWW